MEEPEEKPEITVQEVVAALLIDGAVLVAPNLVVMVAAILHNVDR